jgi:hypothetical protein
MLFGVLNGEQTGSVHDRVSGRFISDFPAFEDVEVGFHASFSAGSDAWRVPQWTMEALFGLAGYATLWLGPDGLKNSGGSPRQPDRSGGGLQNKFLDWVESAFGFTLGP